MRNVMLAVAAALCAAAVVEVRAAEGRTVTLQPVTATAPIGPTAKKTDPTPPPAATDFYYNSGRRIPLERSQSEVAVVLKDDRSLPQLPESASFKAKIMSEGRAFRVVDAGNAGDVRALANVAAELRGNDRVEVVAGVFFHRETGSKMLGTDEIIVKLRPGGTREALMQQARASSLRVVRPIWRTADEFVLALEHPRTDDALEKARLLYDSGDYQWVEPNFIREYRKSAIPSDPRFGEQWHLNNTGQNGGTPTADADAVAAWNVEAGRPGIVIAIVDDGVERSHEDLAANLFTNPGEITANGIDDDRNGFVDDVHGWDFSNNDNDAGPMTADDNHGTAVAGVAAARGNNNLGVSGACQQCRILPVKIFSPAYAGDSAVATALRYAASFADVVNNSWGGGPPAGVLESAIQAATTTGRGGKGSAMVFATGNDASASRAISVTGFPAGTHRFRWTYSKDDTVSNGQDRAWLSWIVFPGNQRVDFESGVPAGFVSGGAANWILLTEADHADEGACLTKVAKSPALTHNQSSYLEVVKTLPAGNFLSLQSVSSEFNFDGLTLTIDLGNDGSTDYSSSLISGVPNVTTAVSHPAAYPDAIAVGSSSNMDCRSNYSQYGPQLALVAPSSGGFLNSRIESTDRTGAAGYDAGNYTLAAGASGFGGTSSAAPLLSGVAGLILSRNPSLTVAQLRTALQSSADKVGPPNKQYVNGRNDRYGFGRVNAEAALLSIGACASVQVSPAVLPNGQTQNAFSQTMIASGGTAPYTYAVTVGSLPGGLSLSAAGVLSGTPSATGTFPFSVLVTDANGCSGHAAFNMVVTPPLGTSLHIVTPCRVTDTRGPAGPAGGPALPNLATRTLQITGACGIPSTARAVVANVTAVAPTTSGFLAFYPTGTTWPGNSTINYRAGKTRANNAVVGLSPLGQATVLNNGATQNFIIDVTGYFQ